MIEEQFQEGTRSIDRKQEKNAEGLEEKVVRREKIDKKKLIVYSTIMAPKFDE